MELLSGKIPRIGVDDAILDLLHLGEYGGDEVLAPGLYDVVTTGGVAGVPDPGILRDRIV